MGLTIIPTSADDNLGPDKADRTPVPDVRRYLRALEWNNIKRSVIEIGARFGLQTDPALGSVEAAIPDLLTRGFFREDFHLQSAPSGWTIIAGGATLAHAAPNDAALSDYRTLGVSRITSTAGAQTHVVHTSTECLVSGQTTPLRFRIKARLKAASAEVGIAPIAAISAYTFGVTINKNGASWRVRCSSSVGGATGLSSFGTADSLWHVWEIVLFNDGSANARCDIYLDGVLAVSFATSTQIPGGLSEPLAAFHRLRATAAGSEIVEVDFYESSIARVST